MDRGLAKHIACLGIRDIALRVFGEQQAAFLEIVCDLGHGGYISGVRVVAFFEGQPWVALCDSLGF